MNNDTFVEFSGSDGDVYSYDTFTLYFTNKNGDKLVAEQRSVRYRRNLPKATVVLEQLARGPLEKGHYPTIPENSEVLSLTRAKRKSAMWIIIPYFRIMLWMFRNRLPCIRW